ncbi:MULTISPECIES: sensor histidine kinase [Gordonibacter]|uniref:histidine kinase n=1 Tax=Gordonibacter faecis TaxID=3047475 RepID=A0ABT7DLJ6_9ACTN|nr:MULTISPECIES: sensor histidine kinase KdpD [unclassified Gordonibacter]MDJ1650413.1 sensor histidine kinase KdpD [Gordonibacter sp. KGMB12511]HIW76743.1 sensor histidine kinase KdpD [Candidatus Gordonibacter avicola]
MADSTYHYALRRDPDAILRQIAEAEAAEGDTRGKLKIFFGYAAGVGKTYAMLEEAHAVLEKGFDLVVGYVEPHTRADTMALVEGLECISPCEVAHRGITLKEFDLDAVLARRPQIVLVDELAHTNAPGCRHRKRYQDVEELLRAGINVFTTVNVQHLESLNDKIAAITQVVVAERIPDRVFDEAASVELVDIEPDDLIERLEAGKVYLPDRARTALGNFFSQKNLAALREIALRRMAERLSRKAERAQAGPRVEAGEDVLVYVTEDAGNVKAIRAAANMAEAYRGTFTALVMETSRSSKLDAARRRTLRANIDVAEELGARVVTLHGDDIARQIAQYAQAAGVTHIVVGNATGLRGGLLAREGLVSRLTRLAHGAVVDVVPVKDLPAQYGRLREERGFRFTLGDAWKAAASVAIASAIGLLIYGMGMASSMVLMLYLLVALLFATRADGFFFAVLVSLGSMLAYNFFFTIPRFTLHAYGLNSSFVFIFLLLGTLLATSLAVRMKSQTESSARRAYRMEVLLESSRTIQSAVTLDECFRSTAGQVVKLLNRPVVTYRLYADEHVGEGEVHDVPGTKGADASAADLVSSTEAAVAAWVAANNERAGATTGTLADARCLYLPVSAKNVVYGVVGVVMDDTSDTSDDADFGAFEKNLLLMIVHECGQAAEQIASAEERRAMEVKVEKETLRSNLLRTISHDLRTPLTSISGDADMLLLDGDTMERAQRERLYRDIHDDAHWLIALVENLLSITRIDNGTMEIDRQPEMVGEVVHEALEHIDRRAGEGRVHAEVADDLLMADMDARLIIQVIVNLVNNALAYSPVEGSVVVKAAAVREQGKPRVRITVTDEGPGISEEDREHLFDLFYNGSTGKPSGKSGDFKRGMGLGLPLCRSIVEVHGGTLEVRNVQPRGCEFSFSLPAVNADDVVGEKRREERRG